MTLSHSLAKIRCQFQHLCKEMFSSHGVLYIDGDLHFNYERNDFSEHNLGDDLNIPLLEEISGKSVLPVHYLFGRRRHFDTLLAIGSILEKSLRPNSIVWGAGFIAPPKQVVRPRRIHAVRGPLTRAAFLENGMDCPEIYGDPAILLDRIYSPPRSDRYPVALIPHVTDWNTPFAKQWRESGRKILDLRHYGDWHKFIDELCQCKTIVSSSLHGIILAETYGIPAIRIRLSDNLLGGEYKFQDYFLSYRKEIPPTLSATNLETDSFYIKAAQENAGTPDMAQKEALLKAFPMPKSSRLQ